jgi:hypothetical protein
MLHVRAAGIEEEEEEEGEEEASRAILEILFH